MNRTTNILLLCILLFLAGLLLRPYLAPDSGGDSGEPGSSGNSAEGRASAAEADLAEMGESLTALAARIPDLTAESGDPVVRARADELLTLKGHLAAARVGVENLEGKLAKGIESEAEWSFFEDRLRRFRDHAVDGLSLVTLRSRVVTAAAAYREAVAGAEDRRKRAETFASQLTKEIEARRDAIESALEGIRLPSPLPDDVNVRSAAKAVREVTASLESADLDLVALGREIRASSPADEAARDACRARIDNAATADWIEERAKELARRYEAFERAAKDVESGRAKLYRRLIAQVRRRSELLSAALSGSELGDVAGTSGRLADLRTSHQEARDRVKEREEQLAGIEAYLAGHEDAPHEELTKLSTRLAEELTEAREEELRTALADITVQLETMADAEGREVRQAALDLKRRAQDAASKGVKELMASDTKYDTGAELLAATGLALIDHRRAVISVLEGLRLDLSTIDRLVAGSADPAALAKVEAGVKRAEAELGPLLGQGAGIAGRIAARATEERTRLERRQKLLDQARAEAQWFIACDDGGRVLLADEGMRRGYPRVSGHTHAVDSTVRMRIEYAPGRLTTLMNIPACRKCTEFQQAVWPTRQRYILFGVASSAEREQQAEWSAALARELNRRLPGLDLDSSAVRISWPSGGGGRNVQPLLAIKACGLAIDVGLGKVGAVPAYLHPGTTWRFLGETVEIQRGLGLG